MLPGADDFASHESIKIAKEFDPNGERTLGVVTKIDRVEQGTDIISKLKGEGKGHIKLKLGFVAVRNRTPQEVKDGLRLSDARQKEQDFFEASGKFVPGTYGIPELITRVRAHTAFSSCRCCAATFRRESLSETRAVRQWHFVCRHLEIMMFMHVDLAVETRRQRCRRYHLKMSFSDVAIILIRLKMSLLPTCQTRLASSDNVYCKI